MDDTIWTHPRCEEIIVSPRRQMYRQCLGDAGHEGDHDYGSWKPLPPPKSEKDRT